MEKVHRAVSRTLALVATCLAVAQAQEQKARIEHQEDALINAIKTLYDSSSANFASITTKRPAANHGEDYWRAGVSLPGFEDCMIQSKIMDFHVANGPGPEVSPARYSCTLIVGSSRMAADSFYRRLLSRSE